MTLSGNIWRGNGDLKDCPQGNQKFTGTIFLCIYETDYVTNAEKSTAYLLEFLAAVPIVVHEIACSESP